MEGRRRKNYVSIVGIGFVLRAVANPATDMTFITFMCGQQTGAVPDARFCPQKESRVFFINQEL